MAFSQQQISQHYTTTLKQQRYIMCRHIKPHLTTDELAAITTKKIIVPKPGDVMRACIDRKLKAALQ